MIQVVILLICGGIAAAIANSKGRSGVGWFFGGFFLGLIGIIVVAVLPNLKIQREKEAYIDRENRRLREQLRQERIKAESFRQHTQGRLDVHDNHLGIDTRQTDYQLTGPQPGSAGLLTDGQTNAAGGAVQWYYEEAGQAVGPTTAADIKRQLNNGTLNGASLVWNESLGDWVSASAVPEFQTHTQF